MAEQKPEISLISWLRERFSREGDFRKIRELDVDGLSVKDNPCVEFIAVDGSAFFAAVNPGERKVTVGLACRSREGCESIEQAVLDSGDTLEEFIQEGMDADEEMDYPVRQDDREGELVYYTQIPYVQPEDLESADFRDEVLFYLQGYHDALAPFLED